MVASCVVLLPSEAIFFLKKAARRKKAIMQSDQEPGANKVSEWNLHNIQLDQEEAILQCTTWAATGSIEANRGVARNAPNRAVRRICP